MPNVSTTGDRGKRRYLGREPLVIVWLSALAVPLFFLVAGFSKGHASARREQANIWYSRGMNDLRAGRLERAVNEFHVALSYSRDNYGYQVSLAKALLALNRTEEAKVYFINLWQREPENGAVNLELARIYAKAGDVTRALRYYQNAIYAIWQQNPEDKRRAARLELIDFLLARNSKGQAESELIALLGNLPDDSALHKHVGDLFMQVPDYERALKEYRDSLKLDPHNAADAAGAGQAAFELARYSEADHYLHLATTLNPADGQSANLMKTAQMIQQMDPDLLPRGKRAAAIVADFNEARKRLQSCIAQVQLDSVSESVPLQDLYTQWSALKPKVTDRGIRNDWEAGDRALDLVFNIEEQSDELCGKPSGADRALLLIAKVHEGNGK